MSFIEKNLGTNEKVLYNGKVHWYIYLRGIIIFILSFLFISVSTTAEAIFFFLGLLLLINAVMVSISSEFAITNKRVILKTGAIKIKFIELQLNKSEGLQIEQGIIGRIFNFGTVKIATAGSNESYSFLTAPFEFKKQINNAVEAAHTIV